MSSWPSGPVKKDSPPGPDIPSLELNTGLNEVLVHGPSGPTQVVYPTA